VTVWSKLADDWHSSAPEALQTLSVRKGSRRIVARRIDVVSIQQKDLACAERFGRPCVTIRWYGCRGQGLAIDGSGCAITKGDSKYAGDVLHAGPISQRPTMSLQ
jgi:hypothetical protein